MKRTGARSKVKPHPFVDAALPADATGRRFCRDCGLARDHVSHTSYVAPADTEQQQLPYKDN
jgi:hypothetical protein